MHPGGIFGILVPEFPFSGEHKVYQQNTYYVKKNNLDGFPEFYNALDPVHGVKLEYLIQLLTSPLYFCSKACKLQKLFTDTT
jgi:hypothetical protein